MAAGGDSNKGSASAGRERNRCYVTSAGLPGGGGDVIGSGDRVTTTEGGVATGGNLQPDHRHQHHQHQQTHHHQHHLNHHQIQEGAVKLESEGGTTLNPAVAAASSSFSLPLVFGDTDFDWNQRSLDFHRANQHRDRGPPPSPPQQQFDDRSSRGAHFDTDQRSYHQLHLHRLSRGHSRDPHHAGRSASGSLHNEVRRSSPSAAVDTFAVTRSAYHHSREQRQHQQPASLLPSVTPAQPSQAQHPASLTPQQQQHHRRHHRSNRTNRVRRGSRDNEVTVTQVEPVRNTRYWADKSDLFDDTLNVVPSSTAVSGAANLMTARAAETSSQTSQRRHLRGAAPPDVVNSVAWPCKDREPRQFIFESSKECVCVRIIELTDANYGLHVWPAAPVLAQYIWFYRDHVKGKRVLELGCGTGLPGILAALLGARVTLSDSANLPACLKHCQRNVEANGLSVTEVSVVGVTWGAFSPSLFELGPLDLILGSDVLYEPKDFENVIVTASYLLHQNQHARFWATYQLRNPEFALEKLLKKWNLVCMRVPLDHFDADTPSIAGSNLPGVHQIEMLVMTVDPTQEEPKPIKKEAIRWS